MTRAADKSCKTLRVRKKEGGLREVHKRYLTKENEREGEEEEEEEDSLVTISGC